MRWQGRRESTQVEDRRGRTAGPRVAIGGCGTLVVVLVISWLTGANPLQLLQLIAGGNGGPVTEDTSPATTGEAGGPTAGQDQEVDFVKVVLADTEDTWTTLLRDRGERYELPRLVLFRDAVQSACGFSQAAVGPFYCPGDRKVYLDLSFFDELARRFGASGDFARAYVIAHEVGHHVQNLLGISERVERAERAARSRQEANADSIRLELQADCFAGVWGYYANRRQGFLEPGDVEEGLRAAAAIGDDRLQSLARGRVAPESWTHGSSAMRVRWLRRGLESGDLARCDTFAASSL